MRGHGSCTPATLKMRTRLEKKGGEGRKRVGGRSSAHVSPATATTRRKRHRAQTRESPPRKRGRRSRGLHAQCHPRPSRCPAHGQACRGSGAPNTDERRCSRRLLNNKSNRSEQAARPLARCSIRGKADGKSRAGRPGSPPLPCVCRMHDDLGRDGLGANGSLLAAGSLHNDGKLLVAAGGKGGGG